MKEKSQVINKNQSFGNFRMPLAPTYDFNTSAISFPLFYSYEKARSSIVIWSEICTRVLNIILWSTHYLSIYIQFR